MKTPALQPLSKKDIHSYKFDIEIDDTYLNNIGCSLFFRGISDTFNGHNHYQHTILHTVLNVIGAISSKKIDYHSLCIFGNNHE